ncbi:hypothetical protein B0H19DRAFT_916801, partial [Mycena capillaripes]
IPGTIFDVNTKAHVYGSGKSYNILAGKDGSIESEGRACDPVLQRAEGGRLEGIRLLARVFPRFFTYMS